MARSTPRQKSERTEYELVDQLYEANTKVGPCSIDSLVEIVPNAPCLCANRKLALTVGTGCPPPREHRTRSSLPRRGWPHYPI